MIMCVCFHLPPVFIFSFKSTTKERNNTLLEKTSIVIEYSLSNASLSALTIIFPHQPGGFDSSRLICLIFQSLTEQRTCQFATDPPILSNRPSTKDIKKILEWQKQIGCMRVENEDYVCQHLYWRVNIDSTCPNFLLLPCESTNTTTLPHQSPNTCDSQLIQPAPFDPFPMQRPHPQSALRSSR